MRATTKPRYFAVFSLLLFGNYCLAACMPDGTQTSGAKYRICMPEMSKWNGNLVVYAHGYVAFNEPVRIPEDQLSLPDGTYLPDLVNALGFGFAVSSYSVNGLAVLQGMQDLADLAGIFRTTVRVPNRVYLVGPSQGGIITGLSIEKRPDVWHAGLAACGAIGSFRKEIDYIGDFRVLFSYFFPDVLPGTAAQIPKELIDNWDSVYVPRILSAIKRDTASTAQLLNVANAPVGFDPASIEETVVGVLWYSTFSTNDATQKLGGLPYDNGTRWYSGSLNDGKLNATVQRFTASPAALAEMKRNYETSGRLTRPLVTLHTTGDQILPYWHEPLYSLKNLISGTGAKHVNIPVLRYGHCNLNAGEVLVAFVLMLLKDTGQRVSSSIAEVLPVNQRAGFVSMGNAMGLLQ